MPRLNVNLKEAESRKALPDDTYLCKVLSISGVKKGPKANYVEVVFDVVDGEFEGRKIYHNLMVSGKGAGMFVEFWNKLMGTEYDVDDLEDLDIDTDEVVGQECRILTKQEEYPAASGEWNHKVQRIYAAHN